MQVQTQIKSLGLDLVEPRCEVTLGSIEECPKSPGFYALWIALDQALTLQRPTPARLPPGLYCYLGSARGPGGLQARLRRHLRTDKSIRWHIDQITKGTQASLAWAWTDESGIAGECDLVARLGAHPRAFHPIPGFGSSDCKCCRAHFLAFHP